MLFFTFIKGGGVTPLTGPPNLNGFSSIIRGGGGKSLLTNVNKKMFFFNEGFPNETFYVQQRNMSWYYKSLHCSEALILSCVQKLTPHISVLCSCASVCVSSNC